MSSQDWYNVSTKSISYDGTAAYGAAQFVPSFGPAGLLFVLGGSSGTDSSLQYFPLGNITMYEPISQTWVWQQATGDAPTPGADSTCVVGIEGDDDTYEVRNV